MIWIVLALQGFLLIVCGVTLLGLIRIEQLIKVDNDGLRTLFKAGFASKKTLLKLDEIERKIEAQAAAIEELKPVEKQANPPKTQPVKPRTFSEFKAELGNDATRF